MLKDAQPTVSWRKGEVPHQSLPVTAAFIIHLPRTERSVSLNNASHAHIGQSLLFLTLNLAPHLSTIIFYS